MVDVFTVLAEPTRRRLLDALRAGEAPVGRLTAELGLPQPSVSKHLRVLRVGGLVEVRAQAQHRLYRLRPEPLAAAAQWLEPYRPLWSARLDDLEHRLDAITLTDPREDS